MSERQKALYEYLVSKNGEWVTHADLARELYRFYGNAECCLEPKDFHNTTERLMILNDCREINLSPDFEKIIIGSNKGIKLANEAEFYRYIESQRKSTLRKLARIYKMAKKGGLHNQMDFGGHTVEAFLENLPETP